MSFDLFVFEPRRNVSLPEAVDLYRGLGGNARAEAVANLVAGPRIDAFYEALTKLFPELGDSDDDASPFACAIERAAGAIVLAIVFSRADEVQAVVERLAAEHGLYVLDPQSTKLFAPSDTPRSAIPRKLSRRDGVARFADVVRPALEAMGFASVKKKKDRWRRACARGTFLELGLDLSLNDARPDVALGHEDVVAHTKLLWARVNWRRRWASNTSISEVSFQVVRGIRATKAPSSTNFATPSALRRRARRS